MSARENPKCSTPTHAPRIVGWTMACLPCNATWIGPASRHLCGDAAGYRRAFWVGRLRWALPSASIEHVEAIVARPLARSELARLLGERWTEAGDLGGASAPEVSR